MGHNLFLLFSENNRRESYSPRMERKQRKDSPQLEPRRKTLAELALESGYKVEDCLLIDIHTCIM